MQKQTKPKPLGLSMAKLVLVVAIIASLGAVLGVAGWMVKNKPIKSLQPTPTLIPTPASDETANWKTYKSEKYGIQFNYPKDLTLYSEGPNIAEQDLEAGKTISGTAEPSHETLSFRNASGIKKFEISVFHKTNKALTKENYESSFYLSGICDLRYLSSRPTIEIMQANEISIIHAFLINEKVPNSSRSCYYFKNVDNNLIVLSLLAPDSKSDYETTNKIAKDLLFTIKFIEKDETVNKTIKEEFLTSRGNFDYKLETFGDYSKQNIDQRLVKINKTGKREILILNIKETLPELKERFNLLLSKFAVPSNSDKVFLKSVLIDTDNPGGVIYSCNLSTSEFEKLKINDVYNGFFGGFALSPDQTKFIWIPQSSENGDDKEMYLIDLARDEHKILIKLKDRETFNGGKEAMLSHQFVEWFDNSKIRYAVYDQTKKSVPYYNLDYDFQESIDKILVENRELVIKQ